MWRKIWSLLIAVCAWQGVVWGQAGQLPRLFDRLTQMVGEHPKEDDVYIKAEELLWDVFPQNDSLKLELVDFVKHGEEGPRLCFAGLALIPFHDPATARPILERAMDGHTSPAMRSCFSRAAYRLLNGPPVKWYGEHDDKELDPDSDEALQQVLKDADDATRSSIGHLQAGVVQELMEFWSKHNKDNDYGDFVEAFTNQTSRLGSFLDLRDEPLLGPALTFPDGWVFDSMIANLDYAVNRDFLGKLVGTPTDEYTPETKRAAQAADKWWQKYLREHPDGDWRPAVIAGFRDAGYKIEKDYGSSRSQQELLRALDDPTPRIRYNAYRLLNEIYNTHFDLDLAFFWGSYNFHSLEIPRDNHRADNEARLKKYWQKRLGQPVRADVRNGTRPGSP